MLKITSQEVDPKAAALTTETFEMITQHWQTILPEITVVITRKPFNQIPELREVCDIQNKQPGWRKSYWRVTQVICPEIEIEERRAVLWVRYDYQSSWMPPDYYFQKRLFEVIAKIIWCMSPEFRQEILGQVTGMACDSEAAAYLAFRDSFSRFFLNPEYLKERKQTAWSFMKRLDHMLLLKSKSSPVD